MFDSFRIETRTESLFHLGSGSRSLYQSKDDLEMSTKFKKLTTTEKKEDN